MGGRGEHARKEQSYPIIRNAVCTRQKALIHFLLKDGPADRRTPKRNERDLPASCGLRRDERTRPASRCDQPSASEMRPASTRCHPCSSRPEQRRGMRSTLSVERYVPCSSRPDTLELMENQTPATGRNESRRWRQDEIRADAGDRTRLEQTPATGQD